MNGSNFMATNISEILIIANSPEKNFGANLRGCLENKFVIALDGAADLLKEQNIRANIIIGDLDSINSNYRATIFRPDQNKTDLEKGLVFIFKNAKEFQGLKQIKILNSQGGRLDHSLNNLRLLKRFHNFENRKIQIIIKDLNKHFENTCEFVKNNIIILEGDIGDQCAIMAAPKGKIVKSKGLRWEANNFDLEFGLSESACNQLALEKAEIEIEGEAFVILSKEALRHCSSG